MPVTFTDIGHRFGDGPWLFHGISTTIEAGEVVGLVGPSGSGKSTLLSLVAGFERPARGKVDVTGRVAWVFQNPHGVPGRTACDHVALPLLAQGASVAEAEERARDLLASFGISHVADQPFRTLSGGEGQRLMLARAVASAPAILLVDEPTAQLDQATAHEVARYLHVLAGRDVAVVIATHDPSVRDSCTRVIDLAEHMGPPEDEAPRQDEAEAGAREGGAGTDEPDSGPPGIDADAGQEQPSEPCAAAPVLDADAETGQG